MESVSVENTIDQPDQPITCLGYTLDIIKMSRLSDKQKHKDGFCFLATSQFSSLIPLSITSALVLRDINCLCSFDDVFKSHCLIQSVPEEHRMTPGMTLPTQRPAKEDGEYGYFKTK